MTIFPKNNLPTASLNWGRDVEKSINNLESSFRTAEVNNVSRDAQLQASYKRLDTAVTQLAATNAAVDQAQSDSIAALQAAQAAQTTATTANTTAIAANTAAIEAQQDAIDALQGLGSLDEATSTYKIHADNITVGSLSGNRISGGEIVGTLLRTASSGARVQLNLNDIAFYDDTGDYSGKIDAQGDGRSSTLNIDSQGLSGMYLYNGGLELYANGPVGVNAQQLISYGAFSATGNATISGTLSGNGITSGGALTRSQLNGDGLGLTGASITATGNFVRTSSSARYKQDIQDLQIPYEAVINLQPKTFRRKEEVKELGDKAKVYPGFIAEDIADSELDIFAFYRIDENGNKIPEGVHYPELTAALVSALKHQDTVIKSLEARLAALEDRVQ